MGIDKGLGHANRGKAIPTVSSYQASDTEQLNKLVSNPVGAYEAKTPEAEPWVGFGSALKPAYEPIVVARKPFKGTLATNVLTHGTGALNIDGCRIEGAAQSFGNGTSRSGDIMGDSAERGTWSPVAGQGRWPANVILAHSEFCEPTGETVVTKGVTINRFTDGAKPFGNGAGHPCESTTLPDGQAEVWNCVDDCPIRMLDEQAGPRKSGGSVTGNEPSSVTDHAYGEFNGRVPFTGYKDKETGPSRFFYRAKVAKRERNEGMPEGTINNHPTLKGQDLLGYLCRLVTPPGGVVLDPFAGSGSCGMAAMREGFDYVGIELEEESFETAQHRLKFVHDEVTGANTVSAL